ncbi:MAG: type 1 glutamine amidotransferase [Phenylobacterium sp.]|uniref:type 1 glutamine amidotransferase n=1 Tax=Phenylobacterium sp. TaxID=1871053 RepID=UPI002736D123|nr:type 1 glutamine amidotransferase [Phenylobacterium sp.]MDP3100714.1 type 1 glutamine amidotransferase [Phenylobacterium sp.]
MKLGILQTGAPPRALRAEFGDYPGMFRRLLGEGAYDYSTFDVRDGMPASVEACDAYLITGSPAAAYDHHPWIAELADFLRAASGRAGLVGICFGHQIMVEAFGGRVEKSPKGWGTGLHHYAVRDRMAWMDEGAVLAATASHQDQVVRAPAGARVLAGSDFTPFGMLAYADGRSMSLQLHPEFDQAFGEALIEVGRSATYTEEQADQALTTYAAPDDHLRLAQWIRTFLATSQR